MAPQKAQNSSAAREMHTAIQPMMVRRDSGEVTSKSYRRGATIGSEIVKATAESLPLTMLKRQSFNPDSVRHPQRVAHHCSDEVFYQKHGLKYRGQLQHEKKHERIERARMLLTPAQDGMSDLDGRSLGQICNSHSQECAGNDVCGVMNSQIHPWQAGYKERPAQRENSQPVGDKKQAQGHGEVDRRMIAGK